MKNFAKILLLSLALISVSSLWAQAPKAKNTKDAQVTFYVNYHCESCIKKINKNLPFEKGVVKIKPDLEAKSLLIDYRADKTTPAQLRKAIEKLDFVVADTHEEIVKHQAKH